MLKYCNFQPFVHATYSKIFTSLGVYMNEHQMYKMYSTLWDLPYWSQCFSERHWSMFYFQDASAVANVRCRSKPLRDGAVPTDLGELSSLSRKRKLVSGTCSMSVSPAANFVLLQLIKSLRCGCCKKKKKKGKTWYLSLTATEDKSSFVDVTTRKNIMLVPLCCSGVTVVRDYTYSTMVTLHNLWSSLTL